MECFKADRKTSGQIWQSYIINVLFTFLYIIIIHLLCQISVTVRLPGTSVLNKI